MDADILKVIIVFFWFLYYHFSKKSTKGKIRPKSQEQKRHFHLIDNNCLKQRALDNFTFAWGKAKGFFVIKEKRQIKCITWTSEQ